VRVPWLIFILLIPLTSAAFAQQPPPIDQNHRIIQIDGHGMAHANPDQASMNFAIETKGSTAQEAAARNAQIAQKVTAALKSKVGPSDQVETGNYSLSPIYATRLQQQDKVSQWNATSTIYVNCDPSMVGSILDSAQAAGAAEGQSDKSENSDKATIALTVSAMALTASEASKRGAEKAREVVDAIKAKLGEKGTVKIALARVEAETGQVNDQTQDIIGYQASNWVSVQTGAIDRVGIMIDAAIAAGATRANFAGFNLRDDSKARGEAMADACKDAQIKANAAAQALGLKVKRVMRITSAGDFRPQPQGRFNAPVQGNGEATTPIKPGEITVAATVTVTYELE
jgi:uncharacterized protein